MRFGIRGDVEGLCRRVVKCVLGILLVWGLNVGEARAEGGLEALLNSLLGVASSASGGGCLGRDVWCSTKCHEAPGPGERWCSNEHYYCQGVCGSESQCIGNRCKSTGACISDSDCGMGKVCFFLTKRCEQPKNNLFLCTRDAECQQGSSCDTRTNLCSQGQGEVHQCSGGNELCDDNDASRRCCGDDFRCKNHRCVSAKAHKQLGEECTSVGECDFTRRFLCDLKASKCLSLIGGECKKNSDCFYESSGCSKGVCKDCKREADGGCLLPLGAFCEKDQECESNKCFENEPKVCIRAETACQNDENCAGEPNPDVSSLKSLCAENRCTFCWKPGKKIATDYPCCDPAEAYEGSCLLGLGKACTDGSQCISGNCADGQCQESGNSEVTKCQSDDDCRKVNDAWRCCLEGTNMPSDVCDLNTSKNSCVAWVVCGNGCCEGTEDAGNCPQDCPQNMNSIPSWCTPNVQSVDPNSLSYGDIAQQCRQACGNRCSGDATITIKQSSHSCDCKSQCAGGDVCLGGFCKDKTGICEQRCATATVSRTISFSDDNGYPFYCDCVVGSVTSDEDIATVIKDIPQCPTRRACKDLLCVNSKYRCCDPSRNSYDGECVVFTPEQPLDK